ncbi:type 4 pilus major pilin (plasmid) [Pseudomonas orientalis]|uniref:type 4 pilus major pilin n=1 Tax=Pseudomonas orientalis TaxID=76758 RepID=UPI0039868850
MTFPIEPCNFPVLDINEPGYPIHQQSLHFDHKQEEAGADTHVPLGASMKKQRGIADLPQLAIVLVVGALIAAVAYAVLPNLFAGFRASKITDAFTAAVPAIQTAYQNRTSFSSITTAQVAQNRWLEGGITELSDGVPTGNLLTQWGTVTFASAANGTQAQVTLNNVPSRECLKISTALNTDQYQSVTVNGAAVKTGVSEMDLTAVGTQCNSSNANTIAFTFGRA